MASVDGFGRRGKSTVHLEGLMINQPMMIETIDEEEKVQPLLLALKQMIGITALLLFIECRLSNCYSSGKN